MKYIVPEYYKHFKCKCNDCRHSCCDGWQIRISMKEYYRLVGIECSDNLRYKLDCALKLCHETNKECCAQISTDWRGTCALHREDGLCELQAELGENNLPEVCLLYPRSIKQLGDINCCSCSNSCEEVVELLMNMKEPMRFEEIDLSVYPEFVIDLSAEKYKYCKESILITQNREQILPVRFSTLGNYLYGTDLYLKKPENLFLALRVLNTLNKYFESSISIRDYCEVTQSYFYMEDIDTLSDGDLAIIWNKYNTASEHLEAILPDWQLFFEQIIINHMFYNHFPYVASLSNVNDAFLSLVVIYSFLRFNILGYMSDKTNNDELVDIIAAMFRLIEHSDFKFIAVGLLKNQKYPVEDCVLQLLYI